MISAGEVYYLSSHQQAYGRDINVWKGMASCFFIQVNTKLSSTISIIYNDEVGQYYQRKDDGNQLKECVR